MQRIISVLIIVAFAGAAFAADDDCIECHTKITPNIVEDWKLSVHFGEDITCEDCHGDGHENESDVSKVLTVTAQTCADCHDTQFAQFSKGKHALGWASYRAMPTTHALPLSLTEGMKGCGGCHKIGLKTDEEIASLKAQGSVFGHASCDACHTRHTFSVKEAREPQACQTCHMG
ncbi:MAG: cytochrome C, partial [Candidatus Krumholzibacteria bacterium]|nr:cytochrome C [Candidatus Krumholzibacteria bacterium]